MILKNLTGLAAVQLSLLLISGISSRAAAFNYPDFSSTNDLTIIHDAALSGTKLRLTPAAHDKAGTTWYSAKQDCTNGFTTSFQFQITGLGSNPGYESGGDGFSFSVQNAGLGVDSWEYGPLTNSVGISFNTFYNPGTEVSGNFVGIATNNTHWLLQRNLNTTPINLSDGQVHTASIQYDGVAMSVSIDGLLLITNFPVSLGKAVDVNGQGWVGLGARCGGVAWENHDILNWSFMTTTNANPNTPTNHLPVANSQSISLNQNATQNITLSALDADGDPLSYNVGNPSHGVLSGTPPSLVYAPATNYVGSDSFTFTANDGKADSAPATVSLNVTNVNHAPVANSQSVSLNKNSPRSMNLSGSDADGDSLSFSLKTPPSHGGLIGFPPSLIYIPATNYTGPDSFTFIVNDGKIDSAPATVSINVSNLNHAPIVRITAPVAVIATNNVDALVILDGSLSSDADGDPLQYAWKEGGVVFATSSTTTNTLAVGAHVIVLQVSDGFVTRSNAVTVNVIAPPLPPFSLPDWTNCINFADFSSTNNLDIIHDAGVAGAALRLTTSVANQAGAAWYASKQFCAQGFVSSFRFKISNRGGTSGGGDGFSFGIQNASLDADAYEYATVPNGFGISFNTFWNSGSEVSGNFVGICTNGAHWVLQRDLNSGFVRLNDGNEHTAVILYDGAALSISIDNFGIITNYPISLGAALDANGLAWVGFGARTGGAWETHDILNWSFCTPGLGSAPLILTQPANQTVVAGGSASFSVVASSLQPLNYQWHVNAADILGATNASLTLANVQAGDVGAYTVTVSNDSGSVTSSNAMLVVLSPPTSACITFADFSLTNNLGIIHDAAVAGSALRLTASAPNQAGAAWYASKLFCAQGFTSTFRFKISDLGGLSYLPSGGDGFSFGVQNASLDLDAYEYSTITNGVGVSFNTFWNPGLEVSGNFVGICSNGPNWVLQQNLNGGPIQLNDGNEHAAVVDYDGAALSVSIDNVAVITNYPVALGTALDSNGMAWVGFGARTGGAWETHDILSWSFCSLTNSPVSQATVLNQQRLAQLNTDDVRNHGQFTKVARLSNQHTRMELMGIPGKTYTVEASTNLVNWEAVGSAIADQIGKLQFEDVGSTNLPTRYYRVNSP